MATGSEPLASWAVEFDGSSALALDGVLDTVEQSLHEIDDVGKRAGDTITEGMNAAGQAAKALADSASDAAEASRKMIDGMSRAAKDTTGDALKLSDAMTAALMARDKLAGSLKLEVVNPDALARLAAPKVGPGLTSKAAENFGAPKNDQAIQKTIESAGIMARAWNMVGDAASKVGNTAMTIGRRMGVSFGGMVAGGMIGTAEGERMALTLQLISREVANSLAPTIRYLNDLFGRLLNWMQSFDRGAQKTIGALGAMLSGATSGAMMGGPLGALAGAFAGLALSTDKGRAAIEGIIQSAIPVFDQVVSAFEGMLPLLELVTQGLGKMMEGMNWLIKGLVLVETITNPFLAIGRGFNALFGSAPQPPQPRDQLNNRGGGFEAIGATWERIQSTLNRTDIPAQQLAELRQINANTRPGARQPSGQPGEGGLDNDFDLRRAARPRPAMP